MLAGRTPTTYTGHRDGEIDGLLNRSVGTLFWDDLPAAFAQGPHPNDGPDTLTPCRSRCSIAPSRDHLCHSITLTGGLTWLGPRTSARWWRSRRIRCGAADSHHLWELRAAGALRLPSALREDGTASLRIAHLDD
jgi:hypothetical protein